MALGEYAAGLQKPVFQVDRVELMDGSVVVMLVNRGPGGAYVKQVLLYRYEDSPVPASADTVEVDRFVPVGGEIQVINESNLLDHVTLDRPLRVGVVTDKGVSIVSYPPTVGTVTVNIHLPSYANSQDPASAVTSSLIVAATCDVGGGRYQVPPQQFEVPCDNVTFGVCSVGNTLVAKFPAIGSCNIHISGQFSLRAIGPRDITDWDVELGWSTSQLFAGTLTVLLQFDAHVDVKAGQTVNVDVAVPEVITGEGGAPLPPGQGMSPSVIDFS